MFIHVTHHLSQRSPREVNGVQWSPTREKKVAEDIVRALVQSSTPDVQVRVARSNPVKVSPTAFQFSAFDFQLSPITVNYACRRKKRRQSKPRPGHRANYGGRVTPASPQRNPWVPSGNAVLDSLHSARLSTVGSGLLWNGPQIDILRRPA
jgi:hypothetical protein